MDYLHIIYNDYNVQRLLEDVGGKVSCGSCVCVARAAVATHCGSHDLGCKPRPWKASKWQRRKKNVYTVAAEATMVSWGATEATTATVDQGGPVSPQTVHTSQLIATHCNWHHIVASHSVVHPLKLPCHVEKGVEEWKMVEDGGRWWKMVEENAGKQCEWTWMDVNGCEWMWTMQSVFIFSQTTPELRLLLAQKQTDKFQWHLALGGSQHLAFDSGGSSNIKHQTGGVETRLPVSKLQKMARCNRWELQNHVIMFMFITVYRYFMLFYVMDDCNIVTICNACDKHVTNIWITP